ncbi:TPA: hypothetical protein DDZ86_01150 [Candidatus Dependentiae bacterium]|nr:MAG: hypothetical protein UW09_C0004G0110 [candidate division TM6 bacterium GW2011_GWF2_43_87]HBL98233.1 hypothetical protein [Candidatus Dependentiae bacterium]
MKKLLLAGLIVVIGCTVYVQLSATLPANYKDRVTLINVRLKNALGSFGGTIEKFNPAYSIAMIATAKKVINAEPNATLSVLNKKNLNQILDEMENGLAGLKTLKGKESDFKARVDVCQRRMGDLLDDLKVGFFETTTTQDLKKAVRTAAETYQKALANLVR